MNEPSVCAICLTADRPELTRRAVACFHAQDYQNKRLLVWDTSRTVEESGFGGFGPFMQSFYSEPDGATIGELRNRANAAWDTSWGKHADILIHLDSDDWSAPTRFSEQVAFLQQSGAGCVGYDKMLFWRQPYLVRNGAPVPFEPTRNPVEYSDGITQGESWLYLGHPLGERYALGTSLAYWTSVWKRRPFDNAKHVGEDKEWIRGVDTRSISSLGRFIRLGEMDYADAPRMVARIHGSNTGNYDPEMMRTHPAHWRRTPEYDSVCRQVME